MKKIVAIVGLGILAGCSTVPETKLSTPIEKSSQKVRIKLESDGKIAVTNTLKANFDRCPSIRGMLAAEVKPENESNTVPLEVTCTFLKGQLSAVSKMSLPRGSYVVNIKRANHLAFVGNPMVVAKYDDPEFNPVPDSLVDGAQEMAAGQTVKGSVNYDGGSSTHWIKVKGKNGSVALTFLESSGDVQAAVYQAVPGGKNPVPMGALVHKKKRSFSLRDDNVLVKITAKPYTRERAYSLVRGEGTGGGSAGGAGGPKLVRVPVVDFYRVGEASSVVLLQAVEGLKVNDEIAISGRKATGEPVILGRCQVMNVEDGKASCRIEEAVPANIVEYRAEAKKEGV